MTGASTTKAEQRALAYAQLATEYRLESEIDVRELEPATYYSDGSVMFPAFVAVWVTIREPYGIFANRWIGGWRTTVNEDGSYGKTRWITGWLTRSLPRKGLKLSVKFRRERRFADYTHGYSYRARAAEPAIAKEACGANG